MTDDQLGKLPNLERPPTNKPQMYQIVGGVAGNLASNIVATIFSPTTGVILAIVAIACWAFSAYPVEKHFKTGFRTSPFTWTLVAIFFLGTFVFTCNQSIRAYERIRFQNTNPPVKQPNCQGPTGPAIASGNGNEIGRASCRERA